MTTEVQKRDDLCWICWNVCPVLVFALLQSLLRNLLHLFIKTHNFLANTWSSAVLLFVRKIENMFSGTASTIVHYRFCQYTHKCALSRVYITNNGDSCVIFRSHSTLILHLDEILLEIRWLLNLFELVVCNASIDLDFRTLADRILILLN